MEKRVQLKTTEQKFFKQVLELVNPILKLRKKEIDVLAVLMYKNNTLKSIALEHRIKLILEPSSRKEMRLLSKQSEASFNNNLSILKKKAFITDKGLNSFL